MKSSRYVVELVMCACVRNFARARGLVCLRARVTCVQVPNTGVRTREQTEREGDGCEVTFEIASGGTCRRRCRGRRGMRGP
jgi:hypothetical protein